MIDGILILNKLRIVLEGIKDKTIKNVTIPDRVSSIGDWTFDYACLSSFGSALKSPK